MAVMEVGHSRCAENATLVAVSTSKGAQYIHVSPISKTCVPPLPIQAAIRHCMRVVRF